MRSPRLTVLDLEFSDQTMATHAATSIFIRIIALPFLSESVMQEGQTVLWNSMQDCESNFSPVAELAAGHAPISRLCKNKNRRPWKKGASTNWEFGEMNGVTLYCELGVILLWCRTCFFFFRQVHGNARGDFNIYPHYRATVFERICNARRAVRYTKQYARLRE